MIRRTASNQQTHGIEKSDSELEIDTQSQNEKQKAMSPETCHPSWSPNYLQDGILLEGTHPPGGMYPKKQRGRRLKSGLPSRGRRLLLGGSLLLGGGILLAAGLLQGEGLLQRGSPFLGRGLLLIRS